MLSKFSLPLAVILGAVLVCATLLLLNVRTTYVLGPPPAVNGTNMVRMVQSGCTVTYLYEAPIGLSCPLWVWP